MVLVGNQGDMPVGKSLLALDHMISLLKHAKNFKRKACKYVEKSPTGCSGLYQESEKTWCIGEEYLKYGISV